MEGAQDLVLSKVLEADEVDRIELPIRKKLEKFYETRISEFFTAKAISETAQKSIETIRADSETKVLELSTRVQELDVKLDISQSSVGELRQQLDVSRQEVLRLQDHVARYESEVFESRRERKAAEEERDSLAKLADRRHIEIERLQCDITALEQQLQAASMAKCEALAKVHEVESKELAVNFKEKRIDQEKVILTHQIKTLSEDLNRNISELQTIRREHTLNKIHLEAQLSEKTEELKIIRGSTAHLEETNAALQSKAEELTAKLHGQNEETSKILNHYKKELASKSKLVDMMKEAKMNDEQQVQEMSACITELKKMLTEAAERYGQLETRLKGIDLEHTKDLDEKEQELQRLRDELVHANDLLKMAEERNLEQAVQQLAPTAAASSRLIKTGTSLTEIYSMYVKASEELQVLKKENAQLNLRIRSIIEEVEERAPQLQKQALDNQKLEESNIELTNQLETLIRERVDAKEEFDNMAAKLGHAERECKRLRQSQSDLGLQVCYLMKEIEQMRGGFASEADQSITSDMSVSEVISKKLVTFGTVQELQENNQKLLHVVRDLSAKLEEIEEIEVQKNTASFEAKLAAYLKRIEELQHSMDCQSQMMQVCIEQRDRYKKMYSDLSKSGGNRPFNLDGSIHRGGGSPIGGEEDDPMAAQPTDAKATAAAVAEKERKIADLEQRIRQLQDEAKATKEEFTATKKEHFEQEKKLNAQFDSMRTEIRDLTASNCKLMSTVEYNNEQIKLQQKNAATHKRQIQTLEEKNKCYEKIIVKHEHAEQILRNEVMKVQSEFSRAQVQLESLRQEYKFLKEAESRVRIDMEALHKERLSHNLLMNNLDMLKASFDRSESEGKQRLEERLDQANRECSALRRRLQEEQDNFRLLSADLERQTATAKKIMDEEVAQVDRVRAELKEAREEVQARGKQIEELSKKLQDSLTPHKSDNPIAQAQKRAKELEMRVSESAIEIESLQKDLLAAKEHAQQYFNLSEAAETELKELSAAFEEFKRQSGGEVARLRQAEETAKARIEDLETEISLQITKERLSADGGDTTAQLTRAQTELRDTLQKLSNTQRELRDSRDQIKSLTTALQEVEQKYSNEMMAHLNDFESMSANKAEVARLREASAEIRDERDRAVEALQASRLDWEARERRQREEMEQLEARMRDHEQQNAALLDQIQGLSVKLTLSSSSSHQAEASLNESAGMDVSLLNRSVGEEEAKSSDQLLQIIKYLRKEKDIAFAKVDVLRSETARLQSEQFVLRRQLEEAQATLTAERERPASGIISASKHEDILRKVETLNAITDSNRVLREERDALSAKVSELSGRVSSLEDQLFPLQDKNRELAQKQEENALETAALRTEAVRWRQRANQLINASNKTNPEDFKRLQLERENLAKMLTSEKEALRRAHEELAAIKAEKLRLDTELANVTRQSHVIEETSKKLQEELQQLRAVNQRMTGELMEVKNALLQREDDLRKANEELVNKEAQLADTKNKENQIRKIAKRYKDSYMELKGKEEGGGGVAAEGSTAATAQQVLDLNVQLTSAQDENETLRREVEVLKAKSDLEERGRTVLKEANVKIGALQEAKTALTKELVEAKMRVQTVEGSRGDLEQQLQANNARVQRMEKEAADERDNVARLVRENESLAMRLAQLQRQLGLQQAIAKPSTSGATQSDKPGGECPRTANVKPMASPSHQSATVTPWRGSETPLASIRPISVQNRTAAVIPTSQMPAGGGGGGGGGSTGSSSTPSGIVAAVQGTSSSSSSSSSGNSNITTALVPPQQQVVHSSGNSNNNNSNALSGLSDVISSSPTSSHTDYMPATSSATVVAVAAIPPMGSSSTSSSSSSTNERAESTQQDASSGVVAVQMAATQAQGIVSQAVAAQPVQAHQQPPQQSIAAAPAMMLQGVQAQGQAAPQGSQPANNSLQGQQQQAVALVSPRMELGVQHAQSQPIQQQPPPQEMVQPLVQSQPPQHHQPASSSTAVTTSQGGGSSGSSSGVASGSGAVSGGLGHKRARDPEEDSSAGAPEAGASSQALPDKGQASGPAKRLRTTADSQQGGGVSESGCIDVEYQVPTSSQRESEFDIIAIDSDDEDDEAEGVPAAEDEDDVRRSGGTMAAADEGTAAVDADGGGPFEDEAEEDGDDDEEEDGAYEMMIDMGYGQELRGAEDVGGPDIDEEEDDDEEEEDNNMLVGGDNNEVEVAEGGGDSNETPQQSGGQNSNSGEAVRSVEQAIDMSTGHHHHHHHGEQQQQQIQTISSGGGSAAIGGSGGEVVAPSGVGGGGASGDEAAGSSTTSSSSSSSSSSAAVATQSNQALWRHQATAASSGTLALAAQRPAAAVAAAVPGASPQLVLQQQQQQQIVQGGPGGGGGGGVFDETGDDCIVPSTPNLFAPRRNAEGFSEAISSPHPQVPHGTRFTFNESVATAGGAGIAVSGGGSAASGGVGGSGRSGSASLVPGGGHLEGIDDTQIDLSQLNETAGTPGGRTVPNTPKLITSPSAVLSATGPDAGDVEASEGVPSGAIEQADAEQQEAVPGPSQAGDIPTITVTADDEEDDVMVDDEGPESDGTEQQNATTSQQSTSSSSSMGTRPKAPEEGTDGVSSEGEKQTPAQDATLVEMEEGREAEASLTPTMNTRSRSMMASQSPPNGNRRGRGGVRGRTPIVWGDQGRGGNSRGNNMRMQQQHQQQMPPQMQQQAPMQMQMSPQQQQQMQAFQPQMQQQMQRGGPRGRRMRGRPMGGNFRY